MGWPYTRLQSKHIVIVKLIQSQVDPIWKTYEPEARRLENYRLYFSSSEAGSSGSSTVSLTSGDSNSD